jgi:hypothetical protein
LSGTDPMEKAYTAAKEATSFHRLTEILIAHEV